MQIFENIDVTALRAFEHVNVLSIYVIKERKLQVCLEAEKVNH